MREVGRLPLVTVIVPVYNTAAYVASCMDSVLSQTYGPLEIVAVDDGSTDGSGEVLARYAGDSRVRVISKANGGLSSARNAALDVASGEYVCFLDSDDTLHRETVGRLVEVALSIGADIVRFESQSVQPGCDPAPAPYPGEAAVEALENPFLAFLDRRLLPSACLSLYRTATVGSLRFAAGQLFEDLDFTWRFLRLARTGAYVKWQAYNYTQTPGSITRSAASARKMESFAEALRRIDGFYRDAGDPRLGVLRRRLFPYVVKAGMIKPGGAGALRRVALETAGGLMADDVFGFMDFSPRWWPWLARARLAWAAAGREGARK